MLALGVALGPGLRAANEPAPAPARDGARPADPAAPQAVITLPTIQVTAGRIRELDKEITRLDKLIVREKKKVKSSGLDKTLNNSQLAHAAAIFGGNSSDHLSAVAAGRVALLETERGVLEAMKRPATVEDLAMLEKELDQLRTTRRNLDNVPAQR
jgi:hypothetical protein